MPAQQTGSMRPACTLAGVWCGGSDVAYQLTISATPTAGHYSGTGQGMFKSNVLSTTFSGEYVQVGEQT